MVLRIDPITTIILIIIKKKYIVCFSITPNIYAIYEA
jgi:hypothetical protein